MSEVTFGTVGGYRVLMKSTGSILSDVFSVDFKFRYYDSVSRKTFPEIGDSGLDGVGDTKTNDTGYSRIILFSMAGGTATSNKGITLLLEKYDYGSGDKVYITAIYNKSGSWEEPSGGGGYLPNLDSGDGVKGISNLVAGDYYHVTFNYKKDIDGTNGFYELTVIDASDGTVIGTRTSTSSGIRNISFSNQAGIGTPNENVSSSQTMFTNWNYTPPDGSNIFAYSSRNLTLSFFRLWDGNVNTSSTTNKPSNLYNNELLSVSNPTSPYPENLGTSSTTNNDDNQKLVFQLDPSDATTIADFTNTAFIDGSNPNGDPATLTNSPTGYPTLSDFGVNNTEGLIIVGTSDSSGNVSSASSGVGDPHIKTIFGENYDLPHEDETFLLYSNQNSDFPVTIKGKCWFLPEYLYKKKINHMHDIGYHTRAKKYLKIFKTNTFFKYIEIVCGTENVIIDMETLLCCEFTKIEDVNNFSLPLFKKYENSKNIIVSNVSKSKIGITQGKKSMKTTLQKTVKIRAMESLLVLKLVKDSRAITSRNAVYLSINNLKNSDIGCFINKVATYSEFGFYQ